MALGAKESEKPPDWCVESEGVQRTSEGQPWNWLTTDPKTKQQVQVPREMARTLHGPGPRASSKVSQALKAVSQPQYYWYFRLGNSLMWGSSPVHCRMFGSITDLYVLGANDPPTLQL